MSDYLKRKMEEAFAAFLARPNPDTATTLMLRVWQYYKAVGRKRDPVHP